jgi:hypothetical protein
MRSCTRLLLAFAAVCLCALPARAAFHLFVISEIYSNADGSVQFIELSTTFSSQQFVGGQTITFSSGSTVHTFTFPSNMPSDSANRSILIATSNFGSLPGGVTPDFTIPANFLLISGGTLQFSGGSTVNFGQLPTNGSQSINASGAAMVNSPRNFSNQSGSVNVPGGSCCNSGACSLALQSACAGTFTIGGTCSPNPCPQPGVCCNGTTCTFVVQSACSGTWSAGAACVAASCQPPLGACCFGAACRLDTAANCAGPRTTFTGAAACNATAASTVPCCRADYNQNGSLAVADIFDYLSNWFAGSIDCDFNGNGTGQPSVSSIFSFINAWFAGC